VLSFSRPQPSAPAAHLSLVAEDDAGYDTGFDAGYDTDSRYDAEQAPGSFWTDLSDAGDAAWRLDALCAETDPEAFFPEKGGSTREAKRVCLGCSVRTECLEFALANDERFGIWGGLSERERRRVRLERRERLSA
jgi:WhiB family redox-sensing transcriptional regulator